MKSFDRLYSICTENHGIITTARASAEGILRKDLARWVKSGRLAKVGFGVYRLIQYPSTPEDAYAIAVASCGPRAYLCGESVIALFNLAPTNPRYMHVAVPVRCRRKIPEGYRIEIRRAGYVPMNHEGIPVEKPIDAIRSCIGTMMPERLESAAEEAYRCGLVYDDAKDELIREIQHAGQAPTQRTRA